jgi:hypothetical protein
VNLKAAMDSISGSQLKNTSKSFFAANEGGRTKLNAQ